MLKCLQTRFVPGAFILSLMTLPIVGCGSKQLPSEWSETKISAFQDEIREAMKSEDGEKEMEKILARHGVPYPGDLPESEREVLQGYFAKPMRQSLGDVFKEALKGPQKP